MSMLSEKYSEQTELSSILDKLIQMVYFYTESMCKICVESQRTDLQMQLVGQILRPFAGEFMKFCLERFEVGIWSSANESNVDIILNIVLEDLKNKLLFVWDNTGVFPVTYDPTDKNDDFLDPEGEFCSYLDDLANATDVQAYIKENSFGQPKIDSSHPDWSFYCKVSKIVSFLA
ncbi:hypothetical protein Bca52824_028952 [Brassica carinata]|uniref:FCP1 homology domain-containing protein n=1 Tax=Brassica carinata TaxID=52824 RepID=A0A8X8ANR7_BRACI|nr:hypothetical protein Bca52824_028952 [Brassica carinata]